MAKRPIDFWQKLAADSGLDDAAQKAIVSAAQNEKFEKGLYDSFVPREESDRHLSEAQKAKADADAARSLAVSKYNENLQWYETNKSRLSQAEQADAYQRTVAAYEALYGPLNGQVQAQNGNGNGANGNGQQAKYVTPEEFAAGQRNYWTLQRQLRRAEQDYQKQFGEPMPDTVIDELESLAQKPENANRNLTDMFKEWVAPKAEEKRTADVEARIAKAKEEAYQQGLAKGRMRDPMTSNPDDTSPLYQRRPADAPKLDDRTRMTNFIETYDANLAKP